MGLFARKPISELQPREGAHSLRRALGAGDLIMLAIGAVIGAGIFSSIGTAAAGEIRPDGTIIRAAAGPALILSFVLLGVVCGLGWLLHFVHEWLGRDISRLADARVQGRHLER